MLCMMYVMVTHLKTRTTPYTQIKSQIAFELLSATARSIDMADEAESKLSSDSGESSLMTCCLPTFV